MAVGAGGGHADAAVVVKQGFAAAHVRVIRIDLEVDQLHGAFLLLQGRLPASEIALFVFDEAVHVRIGQGHLVGQLRPPAAVRLLHAQAVDRVEAKVGDAEGLAGLPKRIVQSLHIPHQRVQFPAEFADVVDPQRPHRQPGHLDLLAAQPAEGLAVQGGVRELAENVAGAGAGQHQDAALVGDVGDVYLLAGLDALLQMVQIAQFRACCR